MILETERMILREYTLQDFNALYEIMSDAKPCNIILIPLIKSVL